jgi:hypothetical protein
VAPSVGIRLIATPVHATAEIERVIRAFAQGPNGGLLILPSATAGLARRLWEAYRRRHRDVQQRKQRSEPPCGCDRRNLPRLRKRFKKRFRTGHVSLRRVSLDNHVITANKIGVTYTW